MANKLHRLPDRVTFTLIDEAAEPSPGRGYGANVGKAFVNEGHVTLTIAMASSREAEALRTELAAAALSESIFGHVALPGATLTEPLILRVRPEMIVVSETSIGIGALRSRPQWTVSFVVEHVGHESGL